MTAEICMMNRLAVVLAADSATTVSSWSEGNRQERYFKGANKVFQLSNMQPVGLMIYDSADILNVPWELLIKSFREHINSKSFNTVEEYAKEMFSYLSNNPRFFPDQIQTEKLADAARRVLLGWIGESIEEVEKDKYKDAVAAVLPGRRDAAIAAAVPPCLEAADIDKSVADLGPELEAGLAEFLKLIEIDDLADLQSYCVGAIHEVTKNPAAYLDTTGLVFAGFGDHEIFPAMVEFESQGMVCGKHIYERKREVVLDHHQPAWLQAFAQTEMVDTFNAGFSFDAYSSIMVGVGENLKSFAEDVAQKSGGNFAAIDDVDSLIQAAREKIGSGMIDKARKEHSLPLRRVLGVLPANEMAELAETLITLQSLKEKVTKPSETVGGPVDVAIITKHEGLVWVKRKHFFQPDLNSRFKLRQAAQHS